MICADLAGCGWSEGVPPQESLRDVVVDVAAELYRDQADPPVDLLEFSDGAFDVLFDAAHELTILMHGLVSGASRPAWLLLAANDAYTISYGSRCWPPAAPQPWLAPTTWHHRSGNRYGRRLCPSLPAAP
jgi:hypothetical protein